MRRLGAVLAATTAMVLAATPALAHVTIQPTEALAGSFFRFEVRVPNEREEGKTIRIEVQFPETLFFVSFQPKEGWKRSVQMKTLDQPVEIFGEPQTEVVGSVTWQATGEGIAPQEFDEFGFSARVPEEEVELVFPSVQTYDSGEVVRWIGPPDSDEPAPIVRVVALGAEGGEGQLSMLAELNERVAGGQEEGAADGQQGAGTALLLSWLAIGLALAALIVSVIRRRG